MEVTIFTEELCLILCRRFRFMDEIVYILYYSFREFVATFPLHSVPLLTEIQDFNFNVS